MAWRPLASVVCSTLASLGQLLLELLLLLVHLLADEHAGTCADCGTDGAADSGTLAAADDGAETCAETCAATAADESALTCIGH